MLLTLDAVPSAATALPDLTETNPKKKNKAYIMQAGQGFLWAYAQSGSTDFYRGRSRYDELERYANGDNEVKSALKKDETGRVGDANARIDFRPLPLLHKPLMSVEGLLKAHSYEATVTAVDPVSRQERADYEAKMRAWMDHQAFLQSLGNAQPGGAGADIPLDEDDLAMHMDVSYQAREAIALEQKIAYGMYLADFAREDQLCTRDEMVLGPSVLCMARRGPRRLPVRIAPGDAFILPASAEHFPNLQAGAHIERLSLGQVLAEIEADPDTTLSPDDLNKLREIARTRQTQPAAGGYSNFGGQVWQNSTSGSEMEMAGQLDVIRFAFVSTDMEVQKEYTNQFGNKQIREMDAGYKGPQEANPSPAKDTKVHRKGVQYWYEGTLILGTEIGYGCRKAYEQLRDEENPFACLPLYIVNAPGMMGRKIKSMVERCKIAVDLASRAIVKMQHAEAKWPDLTVKFNQQALQEAAATGTGGKAMTRSDIIKFWVQEGIVVGNKVDDEGNVIGDPLEFVETPLLQTMTRHWQTIQNAKAEIADITGINGAISGDDPASRQGEGVTEYAIQGSQNALNHLFVAKRSRFERVARAIAASVKGSEARAPLTGTMVVDAQGRQKRTVYVEAAPEIANREFQFKIEQKPTDQQWQQFYSAANNALVQKQITLGDMAFLFTVDNLKQARYLLASRAKRNEKLQAAQAEAASKMQGEQAAMAAKAKGEEDRATDDYKTTNKLKVINAQGEWSYRNTLAQADAHSRNNAVAQDAKLEGLAMQHEHQASRVAAEIDADLAKHDATLSSQESQAAAQRAQEMQLAQQPVAA